MTTGVINIEAIRNKVKTFFKHDKQDGVKKAWYFYHNDTNQFMAMDRSDFETQVALYKSQGLIQYKEVKGESLGSKSCKVFLSISDLSIFFLKFFITLLNSCGSICVLGSFVFSKFLLLTLSTNSCQYCVMACVILSSLEELSL